jgi:hypothetical protein
MHSSSALSIARVLAVFLFMACTAVDTRAEPEADKPLTIARVSSWAELRAQERIELPGGGWIRLGLERTSAPLRSGSLLYGLVGGGARMPGERSFRDGARAIGPLDFITRYKGGPLIRGIALHGGTPLHAKAGDELLFGGSISISSLHTHRIEVSTPKGRLLAVGRIVPTRMAAHPWMSFRLMDRPQGLSPVAGKEQPATLTLKNTAWATPDLDGMQPLKSRMKGDEPARGPLPTLVPSAPDPALDLKRTKDGFVLTSGVALRSTWIADRLLYRLWVNKRPFLGPLSELAVERARSGSNRDLRARRIPVRVDWDMGKHGVKPEDSVTVQLLWCPAGWRDGRGYARLTIEADANKQLPRLSPRR